MFMFEKIQREVAPKSDPEIEDVVKKNLPENVAEGDSSVESKKLDDPDFRFTPEQFSRKTYDEQRVENIKAGRPDPRRGERPDGRLTMQQNMTPPVEGTLDDEDFKFPPHHLTGEGERIQKERLERDMTNDHSKPLMTDRIADQK
jgi:hypothetical protein